MKKRINIGYKRNPGILIVGVDILHNQAKDALAGQLPIDSLLPSVQCE
jgi:hypothetical protein